MPKTNEVFWSDKLMKNKDRDVRVTQALESAGWKVFTVWECEINRGIEASLSNVEKYLNTMRKELMAR